MAMGVPWAMGNKNTKDYQESVESGVHKGDMWCYFALYNFHCSVDTLGNPCGESLHITTMVKGSHPSSDIWFSPPGPQLRWNLESQAPECEPPLLQPQSVAVRLRGYEHLLHLANRKN